MLGASMPAVDARGRALAKLRLSVTDRCNLRCRYCMPEERYVWLPRSEVLRYAEICRVVDVLTSLGVRRVRLTGGEPLLRRDVPVLVEMLARKPELVDIALTTNGLLLARDATALRDAGLSRVTVSLDTLRPDRFAELTRVDGLAKVQRGIERAREAGLSPLKLDCVVMRGVNEDELSDLIEFGKTVAAEVRFIEYMKVGGATRWSAEQAVDAASMLAALTQTYGPPAALDGRGAAPARRYRLPDGTVFGIIAANSAPFCGTCDRCRLTADGMWFSCLYSQQGTDLKGPLRSGASDAQLRQLVAARWRSRDDRGAEQLAAEPTEQPALTRDALCADSHLEMHTRGG